MQVKIGYLNYFKAERAESIFFVMIGILAILLGVYFLFKSVDPFLKGIAYPFIAIALIQVTVGISVYFRTPSDILKVEKYLQDKSKITTIEIPRMEKVMTNFSFYKMIEIGLILIGIFLFFFFKDNIFLKGIGLGLIIQSGVMLTLDIFAEVRGTIYLNELKNNSKFI